MIRQEDVISGIDINDQITTLTLNTWYSVIKQLKVGREFGLLKWLAFDKEFTPGTSDSRFKQ